MTERLWGDGSEDGQIRQAIESVVGQARAMRDVPRVPEHRRSPGEWIGPVACVAGAVVVLALMLSALGEREHAVGEFFVLVLQLCGLGISGLVVANNVVVAWRRYRGGYALEHVAAYRQFERAAERLRSGPTDARIWRLAATCLGLERARLQQWFGFSTVVLGFGLALYLVPGADSLMSPLRALFSLQPLGVAYIARVLLGALLLGGLVGTMFVQRSLVVLARAERIARMAAGEAG